MAEEVGVAEITLLLKQALVESVVEVLAVLVVLVVRVLQSPQVGHKLVVEEAVQLQMQMVIGQ